MLPTRPSSSRSKRASLTITRSVGKALADVMNKDKESTVTTSTTSGSEFEVARTTSTPTRTRTTACPKPVGATIRDKSKAALAVTRNNGGSDKPTPKPTTRPPPLSTPTPATRSHKSSAPPAPSVMDDSSKPSDKPAKLRASLALRGLPSAVSPKHGLPPSALPKYKARAAIDATLTIPRSSARKRLSDWGEKVETKPRDEVKSSDEDCDGDLVNIERPISPLPRRATRTTTLPVSLSLPHSTSPKRANTLHKATNSVSSTSPRPPKTTKTSASPAVRLQHGQSSVLRPSSSASQRATPIQNSRKPISVSRDKTTSSSRSVYYRPASVDSPLAGSSKLTSSPRNPFQLPETSGSSLLSPPLSPFLDGVSLDSIDAGDVSALLSTIVSPTKPSSAPTLTNREAPLETPSRSMHTFPNGLSSLPPETPISSRPAGPLATDPRQSVLSLRQFLESSGDLEHLLSQPFPAILGPDTRERLLSFGFSPGFAPPPFSAAANRPEPQTPCPMPDERTFTSISQVLFPSVPEQAPTEPAQPVSGAPEAASNPSLTGSETPMAVEFLKTQLGFAESQRCERDERIEYLERQLVSSREAREKEAAELATQVSDLEEQLKELLGDRERETGRRVEELEARLRDKDVEWGREIAAAVSQAQAQCVIDRERLLSMERRKWRIQTSTLAWGCAQETASNELELVRANRLFVEIALAGLDVSIQQLRQSSVC